MAQFHFVFASASTRGDQRWGELHAELTATQRDNVSLFSETLAQATSFADDLFDLLSNSASCGGASLASLRVAEMQVIRVHGLSG
jgi:hypothetical protein